MSINSDTPLVKIVVDFYYQGSPPYTFPVALVRVFTPKGEVGYKGSFFPSPLESDFDRVWREIGRALKDGLCDLGIYDGERITVEQESIP